MRSILLILSLWLLAWAVPSSAQEAVAPEAKASAESPADPIPLQSPDSDIKARLAQLYGGIDGLHGVRPQVRGGIVTLEGTTLNIADKVEAARIAARVEGVVSVNNRLQAEHRIDRRIAPLLERSRQITKAVVEFLPLLLLAVLAFAGFWILGRLLTRSTNLFKRLAPNGFIESLVEQVVRLVFILVGLVVAMSIVGATALLGSVLGAAGVIGLAVGFAVRDTIENYIASILLSIRQPFAPNDAVRIEGFEGRVTRLNARATIITTFDGNEVRIPNSTVYKANIVNLTHTPERRFDFEIGIALSCDSTCALATALAATRDVPGMMMKPDPFALIDRIEAFAMILKVLGWVDQSRHDFGKVKSEAIRSVKQAFDAAGIRLAEPVQNVRTLPSQAAADAQPASRQPSREELGRIRNTRPDHVIVEKVRAARARQDEDLLTHAAPRE